MDSPLRPSPGPSTRSLFGHLGELSRDPLEFLTRCASECGDFVGLRFFHRRVYLLNSPELIEAVLVRNADAFRKSITYRTPLMRRMFGDGVFTSEGGLWSQQRKILHAWLRDERIATYYRLLTEETELTIRDWRRAGETERDVHESMQALTSASFGRFLISDIAVDDIRALMRASSEFRTRFAAQFSLGALVGGLLPLPSTMKFRRIMADVHDRLQQHIDQRRTAPAAERDSDFLAHLLAHRSGNDAPLPDSLIRDELITLFFAGSETTALVLSWGLSLLSSHEESVEVDPASIENVIRETIRLYPPSWVVGRELLRPGQIGGLAGRKGDAFLMSPWVMHRRSDYFERPQEFEPHRWKDNAIRELPRFAYFPFGGGPRACPGRSFAEQAAARAMTQLLKNFHFLPTDKSSVETMASITLQPAHGIRLNVRPRSGDLSQA